MKYLVKRCGEGVEVELENGICAQGWTEAKALAAALEENVNPTSVYNIALRSKPWKEVA